MHQTRAFGFLTSVIRAAQGFRGKSNLAWSSREGFLEKVVLAHSLEK